MRARTVTLKPPEDRSKETVPPTPARWSALIQVGQAVELAQVISKVYVGPPVFGDRPGQGGRESETTEPALGEAELKC